MRESTERRAAAAWQCNSARATNVRSASAESHVSSLVRMLYSRAGSYPPKQAMCTRRNFSPNTAQGACRSARPRHVYEVTTRPWCRTALSTASSDRGRPPAGTQEPARIWSRWARRRPSLADLRRGSQWIMFTTSSRRCGDRASPEGKRGGAAAHRKSRVHGHVMGARQVSAAHLGTTQSALMKRRCRANARSWSALRRQENQARSAVV